MGWIVLEKMLMLVLLMVVGFAAAKAGWVGEAFSREASRMVANVFIVATIVGSVLGVEPLLQGEELAKVIAASFGLFLLGALAGWLLLRFLPLTGQERTAGWLSVFFMNNVFIGFPVVEALFGESALFCASLTNIPFNLLLYSIGVSRLRAGQGNGRMRLREVFSPALVGTFVALVLFLLQPSVPQLVSDTIKTLGNATVPLSMVIIGISLSQVPVKEALRDWRAYLVSLIRLVLCPVASWLVLRLFFSGATLGVLTVVAACPSAAMITILSLRYGVDDTFATRVNFLSTVLCAVTLPVVIQLLL